MGKRLRRSPFLVFILQLDKVYNESDPNSDPQERNEEMERMREHVLNNVSQIIFYFCFVSKHTTLLILKALLNEILGVDVII